MTSYTLNIINNLQDLQNLLLEINEYESVLFDIIKHLVCYKFKDNEEIKEAVKLWLSNEQEALELYGHISLWDTSKIIFLLIFDFINYYIF